MDGDQDRLPWHSLGKSSCPAVDILMSDNDVKIKINNFIILITPYFKPSTSKRAIFRKILDMRKFSTIKAKYTPHIN